jgi:hypothetical protein
VLSGCGGDEGNPSGNVFFGGTPATNGSVDQPQPLPICLAFNGFSGDVLDGTFYDAKLMSLVGDLSAVEPANLYLYDTFVNGIGTTKKPSTTVAKDYTRLLPASKKTINTGLTRLDPSLAMNSADPAIVALKSKLKPSSTNPVILSIPAGLAERPEAPFFPAGTRYTSLIVEAPASANNYGPILSIEAGAAPVQFAAFAHQQDKTFTLRTYDKSSTIDKLASIQRLLLTASTKPVVIQSRFVVLTADGLSNNNLSLESIKRATLPTLGFSSGKTLLQATHSGLFPQLIDSSTKKPIFNDGEHGVFCLGGNNTFNTVVLKDQTFVYPQSASDKATRIGTLAVTSDSGVITESGKHIEVNTLNGDGALNLITVMKKGAVKAEPIIHVGTLDGISNINVVIGVVYPALSLPATGMTLLSFDNNQQSTSPLTVTTDDTHMAGTIYSGNSELVDGKKVVLKSITPKAGLSSGSSTIRSLMAHHPKTQGISSKKMYGLIAALDPMTSVHQTLCGSSAALSEHMLGLHAPAPSSRNHFVGSLADHVTISTSTALDHTVASINLNSRFGEIDLATSVYGTYARNQHDVAFGSFVTASRSLNLNGAKLIPSVAVGYSMDALSDTSLIASGININLTQIGLSSVFARFMTAFTHEHAGLSTTLAMGLDARHAVFNRGFVSTDHDSASLSGESVNGVYSFIEASFASNASRLNITLRNFNHAQIQFGLTD